MNTFVKTSSLLLIFLVASSETYAMQSIKNFFTEKMSSKVEFQDLTGFSILKNGGQKFDDLENKWWYAFTEVSLGKLENRPNLQNIVLTVQYQDGKITKTAECTVDMVCADGAFERKDLGDKMKGGVKKMFGLKTAEQVTFNPIQVVAKTVGYQTSLTDKYFIQIDFRQPNATNANKITSILLYNIKSTDKDFKKYCEKIFVTVK